MMISNPLPSWTTTAVVWNGLRIRFFLMALALLLSFGPLANATTFVMVSDADMVEQAPLIVVGRVLGTTAALAGAGGYPVTHYEIQLERLLKGDSQLPATLTLRVPGGVTPEGIGYKVWGAPQLALRDSAIFFLVPNSDDTYDSLHLMLGVFKQLPGPAGATLALRDLTDAAQVKSSTVPEAIDLPRNFERFADWISLRALATEGQATGATSPDYFIDPEVAAPFTKFTFISGSDGIAIRWFTFDSGGAVPWEANSVAQQGLPGGGIPEFRAGMRVWNDDPTTPVRYTYSGTTAATVTNCVTYTGFGRIVFNDPLSQISVAYSCTGGGVLAQGGPCFRTNIQRYNGKDYHPTTSAFILTNDNIGCYFQGLANPNLTAAELFTHEVGHTLGLGHSAVNSATMFANIHNDGRGASITPDDRDGINTIYGSGPLSNLPVPPSNLAAVAVSSSEIFLTWNDNSTNETSFRIEQRPLGGTFEQIGGPGSGGTQFTASGLEPLTTYEFRVRAANNSGASANSNIASATTDPPPGFVVPPSELTQGATSTSTIQLTWQDNSSNELAFDIEIQQFDDYQFLATVAADVTSFTATGLEAASPYSFRVRAIGPINTSTYSDDLTTQTRGIVGPCVVDDSTLCLQGGLVRVQVNWHNQRNDQFGIGHAIVGNNKSGFFWFFNSENIELVVKSLDGRPVNGFLWFFYGALSDVEYWVRVTQTTTGEVTVYRNAPFNINGVGDTTALSATATLAQVPSAQGPSALFKSEPVKSRRAISLPAQVEGAGLDGVVSLCTSTATRLCLLERFEVEVDWINQHAGGTTGVGTAVPESDKSGFFWFFNQENIELVVKALDGRAINGNFWFFYGALSNVEYTIRVRDTQTGAERTYRNPPGEIRGMGDTTAFSP